MLEVRKLTLIRAPDTNFTEEAGGATQKRPRHSGERRPLEGTDTWESQVEPVLSLSQLGRDRIPWCVRCPIKSKYGCPHYLDCVSLVKNPIAVFMVNYKKVFLFLIYLRITQSPLNSYFIMTTIKAENSFIFPL